MFDFHTRAALREGNRTLEATDRSIRMATVRATNKTSKTISVSMVRRIANLSGFPNKVIRGRRRTIIRKATQHRMMGGTWQGLNRLPAIYNKQGRSRTKNTKRPGFSLPFTATMASGHTGIFRRKLPSVRASAGAWSLNLPIVEETLPVLSEAQRARIETYHQRRVQSVMDIKLDQELANEFDVKPGRSI